MSNAGLFAVGTLVTLIVFSALALLVWGAVLDGRYEAEQHEATAQSDARTSQEHVPPLRAIDAA